MSFSKKIQTGSRNIAKHWLTKRFNSRFFNDEFYANDPPNVFNLHIEENMQYEDDLFKDVVGFCIDCEVPKMLGLSPIDIMQRFDLPTYNLLKDIVIKRNQERFKHLSDVQTKMEKRQEELLNAKGK